MPDRVLLHSRRAARPVRRAAQQSFPNSRGASDKFTGYTFIGVIGAEFITSSRGIGYEISFAAKVAFDAIHGIVPISIFAMNAIRNINPTHLRTARVLRLSPLATARSVLIPAALPEVVTGIRVGFSLAAGVNAALLALDRRLHARA